jgi:tetratricopeptide (TPR) repeat protein
MLDLKTLRLITQNGLQAFALGRILDGIAALHTLMPYCATETIICAEIESLEENYRHMLSFLRQGGDDPKRSEVLAKIQKQGVTLLEQINRAIRLNLNTDQYCKALARLKDTYGTAEEIRENVLEAFRTSPFTGELEGVHQDDLFDLLWTSPSWTAQDTAFWYDFLLGQRDIVQQHLLGALFLSVWEHYDAEKIQLINLLSDSECHRTRISAVAYLLLFRLRYKELASLMPPLPDSLLSPKKRVFIAGVQYEMLLMLISEKNMKEELEEVETLSQEFFSGKKNLNLVNIKAVIETKGRYLRDRLQRGLDPNLSKTPLLHSCEYLHHISHWFLPFDKSHPLFQAVMIDENGNEKQNLSALVDLILDCDIDKMATLYLACHDKDFFKAVSQLDNQELPNIENAVIPEYSVRFIMQDLFRFFVHSPLSSQLLNPFREEQTLLDFPQFATLFSVEDCLNCCNLLIELGRDKQALSVLDNLIAREGASVPALLLKGKALRQQKHFQEAINCVRSAEILQPDNTDILHFLAECYTILNRFEEELEYLQRLAELHPEERSYRLLIPITMNKLGKHEEALQLSFKLDYETSESDKEYGTVISLIADTALVLGKLKIAERYTEKEFDYFDGKKWEAHLRMGHIKLLQNDWKSGLDQYEQFINQFGEQHGQTVNVALAKFIQSWDMLIQKGIRKEDLLLIHDILLAASDNTISNMPTKHKQQ